jgi:ubiquinone/menaquinone biosynthesis C-methylase UbiE
MTHGLFPATEMPDSDWWQALWPDPSHVLFALGVHPGGEAVDLCCGDGLFTLPLAKIARRVLAIDLDPDVLARARQRLGESRISICEFVTGNAYDVATVVPGGADFVLMANTFHGVSDKMRLARAVASILRSQGRFAVVNWHRRPREETVVLGKPRGPKTEFRMAPHEVVASVAPSGLTLEQVIELPPFHYGVTFYKPAVLSGVG